MTSTTTDRREADIALYRKRLVDDFAHQLADPIISEALYRGDTAILISRLPVEPSFRSVTLPRLSRNTVPVFPTPAPAAPRPSLARPVSVAVNIMSPSVNRRRLLAEVVSTMTRFNLPSDGRNPSVQAFKSLYHSRRLCRLTFEEATVIVALLTRPVSGWLTRLQYAENVEIAITKLKHLGTPQIHECKSFNL
jgi:hypothetical protein